MNTQDLMASPADVEFYDDHGWWISPKIFSGDQIDAVLGWAHVYTIDRQWERLGASPCAVSQALGRRQELASVWGPASSSR
jgi:hypothetical protein